MEISNKDFSELTKVLSSLTKTVKNFDDRLTDIENTVSDVTETVTIDLPKAIAEQVNTAVEAAVNEADATENAVVEDATEATAGVDECPACEDGIEVTVDETATEEVPAEGQEFCGDGASFEEFSEKVTKTIEDLSFTVNDLATRINKMFVKVFSEGEEQVNDVTEDETDVKVVEEDLKESPKEFVAEEEPQITDEKKPAATVAAVVETAPVVPAPAVTPVEEPKANFSERYSQVKGIFNM